MKAFSVDNFSALIGLDWADQKHDICEQAVGSTDNSYSVISSQPEALHEWALSLHSRYPDKPVALACELKKGPLIYALSKYSHIVIFPVNPITVAKYRHAFTHSGAKDDPNDARIQKELLAKHMDKLQAIQPDCADIRALAQMVENRRKLVQERVKMTNRIMAQLKNYYPQPLDWFKEKDTFIFCDFLLKWSNLNRAKKAHKKTLMTFFQAHNARYADINEKRVTEIKEAIALTDDPGVIEPCQLMIEALVPQLKIQLQSIETMDRAIKEKYHQLDDRFIFDSLPGAGPQLAPRLLTAFGSNRERYSSAEDLQKYSGVAPVIEQSGKKKWTHWRYSCSTFLRQTFVEWAGLSIRYSFWAKAYYEQQIGKGKSHNVAVRSLAFKWIRIVFRCWKDRKPYDESTYLNALKKRGSPLLASMVST